MKTDSSFHMSPNEFRHWGKKIVDWIADYYENVDKYPVLADVEPGEVRAKLPDAPPLSGEDFEKILKDVDDIIMPGITHWQSPDFFAYFPSNTSGPSILGELLSAGLGVQGMSWVTSPACTELETHIMDWIVDMMGLPQAFKSINSGGGVIQDSASSACLTALLTAREKAADFQCNTQGYKGGLVAYISTQTHSSLEKAIRIAGFGTDNLRKIEVDENFALIPEKLEVQIALDRENGLQPCFVCATVGTTSSNAMDPLRKIGEIANREKLWMHVDGAMSGSAAICPEYRQYLDGLELADSYAFNPHKWLFTNFDCDCFFVKDKASLINTLSILPEYLRNKATESGAVIDYRDWQIPLGRRFRSLKLWFVLRHYGIEGLQFHVRKHVELTQQFKKWIEDSPDFELMAPVPLNLVCFRHVGGDDVNKKLLEIVNATGKMFFSHTTLNDKYVLRMSIGQSNTEEKHIQAAWDRIVKAAEQVVNG